MAQMFNRTGVAKLFYKHLCHKLINYLSDRFPPNLQNIIRAKP